MMPPAPRKSAHTSFWDGCPPPGRSTCSSGIATSSSALAALGCESRAVGRGSAGLGDSAERLPMPSNTRRLTYPAASGDPGQPVVAASRRAQPREGRSWSCHPEYFHHLVAEVVDDLHGDAPGLRLLEGARRIAVERRPRVLVDLGLERRLQRAVGIVGPEEVAWRTKKLSSL